MATKSTIQVGDRIRDTRDNEMGTCMEIEGENILVSWDGDTESFWNKTIDFKFVPPITVDITPHALKTPEGAARVTAAEVKWTQAAFVLANETTYFLQEYGLDLEVLVQSRHDILDELNVLVTLKKTLAQKQGDFLRALSMRR